MIPALLLAMVLFGGDAGPVVGQWLPWPTPEARPTAAAPLREELVVPLPTMTPRARHFLPLGARAAVYRAASSTPSPSRTPTARPSPTRVALRPAEPNALKKAVAVPGALVEPACGAYGLGSVLQVAAGTTLDGRGCVTIAGHGIYIYRADNVTVRGLTVLRANGDGISVNASTGTLIEDVVIEGPVGDGGLDIVHSRPGRGSHVVRRTTIRGVTKAMLLGHQLDGNDSPTVLPDGRRIGGLWVLLDHVIFDGCAVRIPKVHRATVTIIGGQVLHWRGPMIDAQLGAHVDMRNTAWIAGPESVRDYHLVTGATLVEEGTVFRLWAGAQ